MIPVSNLTNLFQKDEKHLLILLKSNKVKLSKVDNIWMVDESSLLRIILPKQQFQEYKDYLAEEIRVRKEEINAILAQLDDLAYLFKSFQKISPVLRLLLQEMASLVPVGMKRTIFVEVSFGASISEIAQRYDLTFAQVCYLHDCAIKCISKKLGFINEYRNVLAEKELEIRKLEITNRSQENKIKELSELLHHMTAEAFDGEVKTKIIPLSVVRTLSLSVRRDLDLDTRCRMCLLSLDLETVEDILRYIKDDGLERLLNARNFGEKSLKLIRCKLVEAGIIDTNGQSELFEYLS